VGCLRDLTKSSFVNRLRLYEAELKRLRNFGAHIEATPQAVRETHRIAWSYAKQDAFKYGSSPFSYEEEWAIEASLLQALCDSRGVPARDVLAS
jgi:hypothetical protein